MEEIDIFKCLDFIRDHAEEYAIAKANRIYMEGFLKVIKAKIMAEDKSQPVNAQERNAYSHHDYENALLALKEAVAEEERLRWLLIGAQAKIEVWRSLSANQRAEAKAL